MGWKCGNEHSSGCMHNMSVAKEVYTITYQRDCKSVANLFVPREHNCVIMYMYMWVGNVVSMLIWACIHVHLHVHSGHTYTVSNRQWFKVSSA